MSARWNAEDVGARLGHLGWSATTALARTLVVSSVAAFVVHLMRPAQSYRSSFLWVFVGIAVTNAMRWYVKHRRLPIVS